VGASRGGSGSAVGLASMGDLEHQHHQLAVLEFANQPVVAHAVPPQAGEIGSQALASLPGALNLQEQTVQVAEEALGGGSVELLELTLGSLRDPKRPGQALSSHR